jgi:hypothetical protein
MGVLFFSSPFSRCVLVSLCTFQPIFFNNFQQDMDGEESLGKIPLPLSIFSTKLSHDFDQNFYAGKG